MFLCIYTRRQRDIIGVTTSTCGYCDNQRGQIRSQILSIKEALVPQLIHRPTTFPHIGNLIQSPLYFTKPTTDNSNIHLFSSFELSTWKSLCHFVVLHLFRSFGDFHLSVASFRFLLHAGVKSFSKQDFVVYLDGAE